MSITTLNLEAATLENEYYRSVVYTGEIQLVLMSVDDEIELEKHPDTDQFFRVERGRGYAEIAGVRYALSDGASVIVPKNTLHRIKNTGVEPLKLYTIYSKPQHPAHTMQRTQFDPEI